MNSERLTSDKILAAICPVAHLRAFLEEDYWYFVCDHVEHTHFINKVKEKVESKIGEYKIEYDEVNSYRIYFFKKYQQWFRINYTYQSYRSPLIEWEDEFVEVFPETKTVTVFEYVKTEVTKQITEWKG